MKLLNTDQGIARLNGDTVELLDSPCTELGQAIADGQLEALKTARVKRSLPLAEVTTLSPIAAPPRYFIIGLNYQSHVEETGLKREAEPIYGIADGRSVLDPGRNVVLPEEYPDRVDYEGEVGVVIGRRCENVPLAEAWDAVAGLTPVNDVSARDVQRQLMTEGGNFAEAKAFPTFKPTGPVLVTMDEVDLPLALSIRTDVNGERRQDGNARDMINGVAEIIAFISSKEPLLPGDILCTGTPDGVGVAQGKYLKSGDLVQVRIGDWPVLENRIA